MGRQVMKVKRSSSRGETSPPRMMRKRPDLALLNQKYQEKKRTGRAPEFRNINFHPPKKSSKNKNKGKKESKGAETKQPSRRGGDGTTGEGKRSDDATAEASKKDQEDDLQQKLRFGVPDLNEVKFPHPDVYFQGEMKMKDAMVKFNPCVQRLPNLGNLKLRPLLSNETLIQKERSIARLEFMQEQHAKAEEEEERKRLGLEEEEEEEEEEEDDENSRKPVYRKSDHGGFLSRRPPPVRRRKKKEKKKHHHHHHLHETYDEVKADIETKKAEIRKKLLKHQHRPWIQKLIDNILHNNEETNNSALQQEMYNIDGSLWSHTNKAIIEEERINKAIEEEGIEEDSIEDASSESSVNPSLATGGNAEDHAWERHLTDDLTKQLKKTNKGTNGNALGVDSSSESSEGDIFGKERKRRVHKRLSGSSAKNMEDEGDGEDTEVEDFLKGFLPEELMNDLGPIGKDEVLAQYFKKATFKNVGGILSDDTDDDELAPMPKKNPLAGTTLYDVWKNSVKGSGQNANETDEQSVSTNMSFDLDVESVYSELKDVDKTFEEARHAVEASSKKAKDLLRQHDEELLESATNRRRTKLKSLLAQSLMRIDSGDDSSDDDEDDEPSESFQYHTAGPRTKVMKRAGLQDETIEKVKAVFKDDEAMTVADLSGLVDEVKTELKKSLKGLAKEENEIKQTQRLQNRIRASRRTAGWRKQQRRRNFEIKFDADIEKAKSADDESDGDTLSQEEKPATVPPPKRSLPAKNNAASGYSNMGLQDDFSDDEMQGLSDDEGYHFEEPQRFLPKLQSTYDEHLHIQEDFSDSDLNEPIMLRTDRRTKNKAKEVNEPKANSRQKKKEIPVKQLSFSSGESIFHDGDKSQGGQSDGDSYLNAMFDD